MNDLTTRQENSIAVLDGLAREARLYSEAFAMNAFQLGRVLTEAKKLIKHGDWLGWVHENTGLSEKMVQDLMRSYQRFGNNPALGTVEKSKLFKLLSLPEGAEDEFLEKNDVSSMSVREVGEAVKQARKALRDDAENRLNAMEAAALAQEALERRPQEVPDELAEEMRQKDETIARQKAELDRLTETARTAIAENNSLRRENKEQGETIEELNEEYRRAQNELLNAQSAIARGDAERMPADSLTPDVFAAAVRQFYGTCARLPMMGKTLATMDLESREQYDVLLGTMEKWCEDSRRAMNMIVMDGGVVLG